MLPQHLVGDKRESRSICLDTGHTGTLVTYVVYQARGNKDQRTAQFRAQFTPDDPYQEWDEEDQDYNRSSIVGEFNNQQDLDAYVAQHYREA